MIIKITETSVTIIINPKTRDRPLTNVKYNPYGKAELQ